MGFEFDLSAVPNTHPMTTNLGLQLKFEGDSDVYNRNMYVLDSVYGDFAETGVPTFASLTLTGLPTSDPHVAGQLYNLAGTVKVSAG